MARILIADSDPIHREIAGICLERHSHRISVVADGSAAIRKIEHDPPDLILADVMLPMRSGYDILNAIERQPSGLRLPVIFLTARSTNADMARALTAGVRPAFAVAADLGCIRRIPPRRFACGRRLQT